MASLELWKISIDLALMAGLGYIAYRFIRGDASPLDRAFLRELEGSLKTLISDAEQAGRSLSVELNRRKHSLQQTLVELESMEQQVGQTIQTAQKKKYEIDQAVLEAKSKLQIEVQRIERTELQESRRAEEFKAPAARGLVQNTQPEPESFSKAQFSQSESDRQGASAEIPTEAEAAQIDWSRTNIFGESIGSDNSAAQAASKPSARLSEMVTTEVKHSNATSNSQAAREAQVIQGVNRANNSIKEIYLKAEELLRRGQGLAQVASRTNLPITEVRILSDLIQKEQQRRDEPAARGENRRAGGAPLAGMRREVQTV